ncbi:MICOS complex subunit MIC25-like [Hylaeus volcanicus]|uniref:MICOS complex subunit MIC25-like n=1 Tax=Hylaeus volcanicus TaxID=313075 RepID=UPI0023B86DE3|nr:MICOS complex subunit MIC25-like [Hylaeus volcanicus]XP_053976702.1 MICOS complex subunit MIC25-like [Hylaeus volcanicus]XP_053976712.1 MICOS complex subunit MIC25-like [Hylaeus volcanicus]XP_053976719.1 MICOS complex subunit MIC25-like [Hylaeus volcanicus]
MGAGQSARKLTIDNDEEIDVIKVSNAVVQRLTQRAKETSSGSETKRDEVRPTTDTQSTVVSSKPSESSNVPLTSGYPVYHYPQLTLSALEIQQQKEHELHSQDQYWQNRLKNLEKNHLKINNIMDQEYKKATEELYVNDQKNVNVQDAIQPCLENTTKVLKCYQEYPKEILMCSNLVKEFSNCVDQRRARVIAARC